MKKIFFSSLIAAGLLFAQTPFDKQIQQLNQEIQQLKYSLNQIKIPKNDFVVLKTKKKNAKDLFIFAQILNHYVIQATINGKNNLKGINEYLNTLLLNRQINVPKEFSKLKGVNLPASSKIPMIYYPKTVEGFPLVCYNNTKPHILEDNFLKPYTIIISDYKYSIAFCVNSKNSIPVRFYVIKQKIK